MFGTQKTTKQFRKSNTRTTENRPSLAIQNSPSSKLMPIAIPMLPSWNWTLSSAPFTFEGSGTTATEEDPTVVPEADDGATVVFISVEGVTWDADTEGAVGVVTVGVVTVGAMTEVIVVGGKVRDGKLGQRTLNSEAPNDAMSQVLEDGIKWRRLPSSIGSTWLAKLGFAGIAQFRHCWISVSLSVVQRQETAVQESYNSAAGVHALSH